ncbi:ATP-binding protein [Alkalicella caledoniensis]|uniref:ATP-binding protein n=1 Tax=Alkalicella caledoniensis TaxID=2731377 RepID=A0A7G9WDJ5_ALKCA|nr:ATP-binding protein [Alkalicella caledoniensis]
MRKLEKEINLCQENLSIKFAEKRAMENIKQKLVEHTRKLEAEIDIYNKVRILLNNSADHGRKQAQSQIELLVTKALQYIFDENHYFKIEFQEKSNRIEAEFYVCSMHHGVEIKTKPEDSRGGGVVDIVSLALRIALMETYRPKLQGPIILDEPAKHVSEEYIARVALFLKSVNTNFNRQIIMVTHNSHLMESADEGYRVEIKNGITWVNKSH